MKFEEYFTKTWCSSGNIDDFDTTIERSVWDFQQERIDKLEKENAELIGIMKNNHAYHGDNNSWKCNDDNCVGCMIERRKENEIPS